MPEFHAHSGDGYGRWHRLEEHLRSVATLAAGFTRAFGAENEARLAGLLHDLGKLTELFQQRLQGLTHHIDHWSIGAWAALSKYPQRAIGASLAIAGHHLGLPDRSTLANTNPAKPRRDGRTLSESDLEVLLAGLEADGVDLPQAETFVGEITNQFTKSPATDMLDCRMLFSALVDADFLDTEAHFKRGADGMKRLREPGPELDAQWALDILLRHIDQLAQHSNSAQEVNQLRSDLFAACLHSAERQTGTFTLSAPTGAGKTLSMLAFALKHAADHGLRRVVLVIPYLSIIDQTVEVLRQVFASQLSPDVNPEHYILEHHSLAGLSYTADYDDRDEAQHRRQELTQNWDAPIVVTTSVQMLHSMFSNRPGACRKLHRLASSVILFDEVQTLPNHLAAATLATLNRLCTRFGSTVVFSTATQPAFTELNKKIVTLGGVEWDPKEIAPPDLFERIRRVQVRWPEPNERLTILEIAERLSQKSNQRSLSIFNLKRHAGAVLAECRNFGSEGLYHLSTSMCPAHRTQILKRVRELLADPAEPPVRLISTQCVEAGVDLDFPVVWRAWGPLTAIAQAAGRCNRGGNLSMGSMRVFNLDKGDAFTGQRLYPDIAYKQAADTVSVVLRARGTAAMDIDNPEVFREFYSLLYGLRGDAKNDNELEKTIKTLDFPEVARLYQLINNDTVNVLVPYDGEAFAELADLARHDGLSREWINLARQHSVSIFRPVGHDPLPDFMEPIPLLGQGSGVMSDDWFICRSPEAYDPLMGLDVNKVGNLLIA